jgi:hypothetical protein
MSTVGSTDSGELAGFGYKQELDRSLGSFSSFAAGFSYISILTRAPCARSGVRREVGLGARELVLLE